MRIAVYADKEKHMLLESVLRRPSPPGRGDFTCLYYHTYDDFIQGLPVGACDVVIVARDGAAGMEGVRAARLLSPTVSLIWFSDDRAFGPESYRVGCDYFSATALNETMVQHALNRCHASLNAP